MTLLVTVVLLLVAVALVMYIAQKVRDMGRAGRRGVLRQGKVRAMIADTELGVFGFVVIVLVVLLIVHFARRG